MSVTRKYETKEDCIGLLIDERFDALDSTLITELDGWREHWSFVSVFDESVHDEDFDRDWIDWYDEDEGLMYHESDYTYDGTPAWNTWFEPNDGFVYGWCKQHVKELCDECGFVVVLHDDEFWGLAVDGAGYSFKDTHFKRLYDAMDIHWHN